MTFVRMFDQSAACPVPAMSSSGAGPSGSGMTRADVESTVQQAAAAAQASVQAAAERFVTSLANGVSFIALEEWTMQGAVESAIDLLRDRMDPNMADLDQAIPQWVFQRAKARLAAKAVQTHTAAGCVE